MAKAPTAASSSLQPWLQRVVETPPWSPFRLALAIAAGLFALLFALEWSLGRLPLAFGVATEREEIYAQVNFRLALVLILLQAYLPAAYAYGVRGARRTVEEVRPWLRATGVDPAQLVATVGAFDPGRLRLAGAMGIAVSIAIPFWIDRDPSAWAFWRYPVEPIFQRVLLLTIGWMGGRFLYSVWLESRRLSQLSRDRVEVDLLDLRNFAPLTRQGLRYALLTVGVISILALNLFDYEKRGIFSVVLVASGLVVASGAAALLLPLRGAHAAIIAAKRAELDWCDAELRRSRAAAPGAHTLADLVAWRALVAAVQEWPLDAPTLRRFALYLAIPLGSWLGGAFVGHVVDVILR